MTGKQTARDAGNASGATQIYRLHVELQYIAPPIWRRLRVPSSIPLARLHQVLQITMGWTNSHLHQFDIGGTPYGVPDQEWPELGFIDERSVTLAGALGEATTAFSYTYDFGDDWQHAIRVEAAVPADDASPQVLCLAGANACPPEDVGGPPGYLAFMHAITDPSHSDHAEMLSWCGGAFDPRGFDLNAVNAKLRKLKIPSRR